MEAVKGGHAMIITVRHVFANGWHEFTCPQVPGFALTAEASDLQTAFAEVPDAIAEIVEADEGFPVNVRLRDTYSEYVAKLPDGFKQSMRHYEIERKVAA